MKALKTERGFRYIKFKDKNGIECSIQKSSSIEDSIWLGANKIGLKEFVAYRTPDAWQDRTEFDNGTLEHSFIANNRMHLTVKQVKKLLPILEAFVKTGEI